MGKNENKDYRIGFVLEQGLGHVTHSLNIKRLAVQDSDLHPYWLPIGYEMNSREARLPVYNNNWTVRAGWKVRRALRRLAAQSEIDGLFIHTQVLGVLVPDWIRRYPTIISMDATPLQYDQLGSVYDHGKDPAWMERIKFLMNRWMYSLASHLVTWSNWAKDSLVEDYEVAPEKITVIPPGVDLEQFSKNREGLRAKTGRPVKVLFVGGNFKRKGGYLLLDAFRTLRESLPSEAVELHLVTYSDVAEESGVFVHRDIRPGDERLPYHFATADIFVLPTEGDCSPMVLPEAGANALPLISTRVGGIPEIVVDGETGLLIDPGDGGALAKALSKLVKDAYLRRSMGARAQKLIFEQHNAATNVSRLLDVIKGQVDTRKNQALERQAGRTQEVSVDG